MEEGRRGGGNTGIKGEWSMGNWRESNTWVGGKGRLPDRSQKARGNRTEWR